MVKKHKVSVGLINPKSPENVSSVMRLAGNFKVDSVFYTGTRYPRALKRKSCTVDMSRKVSQYIPLTEVACCLDNVPDVQKIVCVEFAENAIPLPKFQHPENAFYIFGPEDGSISQNVIDRADAVVYIPTMGCMNLAVTVSVVLYDRSAKNPLQNNGNTLIRKNRDINNRLIVSF
jgi:tRNA(Leu) C34 or U34 (ribose-2'-O)-methylase TrmL